ncbi:MAG: hypothetical protein N2Z20_06040 [Elusimicrobiales bacterium]|nr:hypothetical protein [Elusimicrobiales bacterium]
MGKDVVVSVVSYTPYSAEEGILRFRISNNQKSFFFINLFQVETETNQKLPIKVFSEQFVSPEQQIEGYILFPLVGKNYNFLISDGKNNYKLSFKIP